MTAPPSPSRNFVPGIAEDRHLGLEALSSREAQVLAAIVNTHIEHAEPVGSKTLAARGDLGCSPATIRNVMAQLHDRGYIAKPHSSAGRIPTTAGLRYFVDCLLQIKEPPRALHDEIATRLADAGSVERALGEAGRVLSRLSQKACIVTAPRADVARLKQIEFVRIRDGALLVILVTSEGLVQNRLLEFVEPDPQRSAYSDEASLQRISRYLSERIEGRSLSEVRALLEQERRAAEDELTELRTHAIRLGAAALGTATQAEIVVEGERHLVEASDPRGIARMHELLEVLEERKKIATLLDSAAEAPGIRVFIGEENPLRELADMSVIAASYGDGARVFGTLGVIGPTRMDYGAVVPLVELTARMVSAFLT